MPKWLGQWLGILWESRVSESNKAIFLSYAKQDAEAAARICDLADFEPLYEGLRLAGVSN